MHFNANTSPAPLPVGCCTCGAASAHRCIILYKLLPLLSSPFYFVPEWLAASGLGGLCGICGRSTSHVIFAVFALEPGEADDTQQVGFLLKWCGRQVGRHWNEITG